MTKSVLSESYSYNARKENKLFWMAGLELEIPVKSEWNIETGARFNRKWFNHSSRGCGMLEIPLRAAYKKQLGNNFSMHVGAGPYASSDLQCYLVFGIEPAITFYWHHLNVGLSYDLPIQRNENAREDLVSNPIMVTFGIRFKTKVWKHIGTGLYAIGTVAQGYAQAEQNGGASNGTNIGNTTSYNSSGSNTGNNSSSYSNSGTKKCKQCGGSGDCIGGTGSSAKYHCHGSKKCKWCNGDGYNYVSGEKVICSRCKGSTICSYCHGTGKCTACGGSGKK